MACAASGKGVKAGLAFMEIDPPKDEEGVIIIEPGFAFGTFVNHDLSSWLSTQGEVLFNVKNFRLENCTTSPMMHVCIDKSSRLYYLELPITFRAAVVETPHFRLHLGGGPMLAASLGGHQVKDDREQEISDLNGAMAGFVMQASLAFGGPSGFVVLESRWMKWFGPIVSSDNGNDATQEMSEEVFAKSLFGFMVGYEFP
jgi:hypothetical protein